MSFLFSFYLYVFDCSHIGVGDRGMDGWGDGWMGDGGDGRWMDGDGGMERWKHRESRGRKDGRMVEGLAEGLN